jgi:hypothetical protein
MAILLESWVIADRLIPPVNVRVGANSLVSEVFLNGLPSHVLQKAGGGRIDPGGVGIAHRRLLELRVDRTLTAVGDDDRVELPSRLVKTISLSPTNEYFPIPLGRK